MSEEGEGDWMAILELLINWNVPESVQSGFVDSDLDLEKFLSLNLTSLRDFVPDKVERLTLYNKIVHYKNSSDSPTSPVTSESGLDKEVNSSSDNTSNNAADNQTTTITSQTSPNEEGNSSSDRPQKSNEEQEGGSSFSTPPRLQSILVTATLRDFDLETYLKDDLIRSAVFRGCKNGRLTVDCRKELIQILGNYLINVTTSVTSAEFLLIREKVAKVFPNEPLQLYYAAPKETGPHQTLATGLLFNRVRNQIGLLLKKKAIQPRRRRRGTPLEDSDDNIDEPLEPSGLRVLLRRARELTADVEDNWCKTADERLRPLYSTVKKDKKRSKRKEARENENPQTLKQYFDEYKILRQPKGYTLLELDFKHLYPKENENLLMQWPSFLSNLQKLALQAKIDDEVGKELVNKLKSEDFDELDENNKDAVLIQLLPSLCPPTARVTVGKKIFKPNTHESRESFIAYTTIAADFQPLMQRKKDRMQELKATLQPYIVFVGPSRWNIEASYIIIDDVVYHPDSVLKTLDLCFKAYHALCAGYPSEANHLWHIFHLNLFRIPHQPELEGSVPMSTSTFLAKLDDLNA